MKAHKNTGYSDSLFHFGIKGMKWGIRRYQNEDGTLTSAGRKRYERNEKGTESQKDNWQSDYQKLQDAKNSVKSNDKINEIVRKHAERLRPLDKEINDLTIEMYDTVKKEANAALKSREFLKDLDDEIYSMYGADFDDEIDFEIARDDAISDLLSDRKYTPKYQQLEKDIKSKVAVYIDECEKATKDVIKMCGDTVVSNIGVKANGVGRTGQGLIQEYVQNSLSLPFVAYAGRHTDDALFNIDLDYSSSYTFEQYKASHRKG